MARAYGRPRKIKSSSFPRYACYRHASRAAVQMAAMLTVARRATIMKPPSFERDAAHLSLELRLPVRQPYAVHRRAVRAAMDIEDPRGCARMYCSNTSACSESGYLPLSALYWLIASRMM